MKILITGFEPFGGSHCNPSEKVACALEGYSSPGLTVTTTVLPVDHQRGPQALLAVIQQVSPDAVICLGEAARRSQVSVERIAINLLDFRLPDNAGNQICDQPILPDGPAAYFATLPARAIQQRLLTAGIPAELSLSAGTYLCNQVMYCLLHRLQETGLKIPAGFIHLPPLPEQAARAAAAMPSMSFKTSLRAIQSAAQVVAEQQAVS